LSVKPEPYIADTPAKIGGGASYPPKDYQKWYDLIRAWAARSKRFKPRQSQGHTGAAKKRPTTQQN